MNAVIQIQILVLAVFFFSAITKLFDLRSFKETIVQLKVPTKLAEFAALTLPIIELTASILFVWETTAMIGVMVIICLLLCFGYAAHRARGRYVECNCFGSLVQEQFGTLTYAKIICLLILSMVLLMSGSMVTIYTLSFSEIAAALLNSIGIVLLYSLAVTCWQFKKSLSSEM
ncbi:MauE/DoxX family redox-associated membrane protein [Marinicrinis lubricantis]|uniref:MauE/DoxX family redox-associated membrane protein n=1 Tax=Marinicrinis lubricantis TaxID=2086470 RepID=A0ABW1IK96_9BACL